MVYSLLLKIAVYISVRMSTKDSHSGKEVSISRVDADY